MLRYKDSNSKYWGYKDLKGRIIVPPNLERFTTADTFYNVIAAHQKSAFTEETYFLFRNGKKIRRSTGFDFDFNYDCESEGKIIFRDIQKEKVGYLGKDGEVVIPAVYNIAHPFYNNVAIVYRNAKKQCDNFGEDTATCENYSWVNGETILINANNEVLINDIKVNTNNINWYSIERNKSLIDTSTSISLIGTDSSLFTFLDYNKEFNKWFQTKFLSNINHDNERQLIETFFPIMKYWALKQSKWVNIEQRIFLMQFPNSVIKQVLVNDHVKQITVSSQPLNPQIFKEKVYRKFYTSCGIHNKERYPLFEVLISTYKKRKRKLSSKLFSEFDKIYVLDYQENLDFIRLENDYKLIQFSIK